ncbi:MAG: class F sortase [Patescibacteria group bacterium]
MNLSGTFSNRRLFIISALAVTLAIALIFQFISKKPFQTSGSSSASASTSAKKEEVKSGLPIKIKIPSIKVDANIYPMGVDPNGEMEAPDGPRNVGWFKYGPYPGNVGSSVIDGHYGTWRNGEQSVFNDLNKLKKGDKIYVEDVQGSTTIFVVHESKKYVPNQDAASVFGSNDGKAHLNIITCEGIWDENQKTYSSRLVVFADKEEDSGASKSSLQNESPIQILKTIKNPYNPRSK